jgi:hypothetical protein
VFDKGVGSDTVIDVKKKKVRIFGIKKMKKSGMKK